MTAQIGRMQGRGAAAAAVCALLLAGAAGTAAAQTAQRPVVSAGEASRAAQLAPARRGLRVDRSGRWSVDFSLDPSLSDPARVGDVGAGAYYRVNPRLRVGASAGLVEGPENPGRPVQNTRDAAPRVRLESTFRF
ncbi:MAG TPA: hypothetical protein VGR32_07810 [Brevundimonas sp.]|jgi:hypothetical protein|uniref:NtrZ family periplasmic regulatory protein n=1 Tax=Brevundimonas sp. TaxID=1871086 RepID=UPI002DE2D056|nr:hypothetical protein [Brevundimonas sp.]